MKLLKKSTAIFMILLTLFTMVPLSVLASDPYSTETQSEVDYKATNALGEVLSDAMTEEQTEQNSGYFILDVTIEDGVATVDYSAPDNAQLIVAIYNEEGTKMLISAKVEVDSTAEQTELDLDAELPEFFLVKAFILDSENKPVCRNFESIKYTQAFQEFLEKETTDFEEEKVINLDESTKNNFAVVSDEAQVIEQTATENTLTINDYENGIFVFENANSDITDLEEGDVLYFVYGEGAEDYILTKVGSIDVEGTTVTITTADEYEMSDFFSYIKIDLNKSSVETEEPEKYNLKKSNESDEEIKAEIDYDNSDKPFEYKQEVEKDYSVSGLDFKLYGAAVFTITLKAYYDFVLLGNDYFEIGTKTDVVLTGSCNITATSEHQFKDIAVLRTDIPVSVAGLAVTVDLSIDITVFAKVEMNGRIEISMSAGMKCVKGNPVEKFITTPELVYKFDANGEVKITITPVLTVGITVLRMLDIYTGLSTDLILTGKLEFFNITNEEQPDIIHECDKCIDGDVHFAINVVLGAYFGITGKDKAKIFDISYPIYKTKLNDFYISLEKVEGGYAIKEYGKGSCPKIKYKVNLTVLDEEDAPIENAVVSEVAPVVTAPEETTPPVTEPVTTNEEGKAIAYFNIAEHSVRTEHEHYLVDPDRMPDLDVDFEILDVEEEEYVPLDITVYMKMDADGQCGDNAYYTLYDDGTLYITGEGAMWDYIFDSNTYSCNAPWFSFNNLIIGVVIKEGITYIGKYSFYRCYSLVEITLPSSLSCIGEAGFWAVFSERVNIKSLDSWLNIDFESEYSNPLVYSPGLYVDGELLTELVIPDGLSEIKNYVFDGYSHLENEIIEIPDGVTYIGDSAFKGVNHVENVIIPDSVTYIGESVFEYSTALKDINIPNDLTTLGKNAFRGCKSLESDIVIPEGVTSIEDGVFYYCGNIKSVTLHDNITSIGDETFSYCENLADVEIPVSVTKIGEYAYRSCNSITDLIISGSVITIGDSAFRGCSSLNTVSLGEGVQSIGRYAFSDCTSLLDIIIPGSVVEVGYGAFEYCSSLNSIIIEEGVQIIGDRAFGHCSSAAVIMLPLSIRLLGNFWHTWYEPHSDGYVYLNGATVYYKGSCWQYQNLNPRGYSQSACSCAIGGSSADDGVLYDLYFVGCENYVGYSPFADFSTPLKTSAPVIINTESDTETEDELITETISTIPGYSYLMAVVRVGEGENLLRSYNLLYIDQKEAYSDTLTFSFELDEGITDYDVLVYSSDLSDDVPNEEETTDPSEPSEDETTEAPSEEETTAPTEAPTTTEKPSATEQKPTVTTIAKKEETTTNKVTTTLAPTTTTPAPTTATSEKEEPVVKVKKPAKVKIKKPKSTKKKQIVVSWNKVKTAGGYQISYSTSKKFKKKLTKTKLIKKAKTTKTTLKKLKSGKKYFIKVRAYKTVNGKKIYGAYSKVMNVKVK